MKLLKATICLKRFSIVALAALLLAVWLPSVMAEKPLFTIEWIDDTPPDFEAIVTTVATGEQHHFKAVFDGTIKITEIDGVPQNTNRIEHPLMFPFEEAFRFPVGVHGAEAGVLKWRWQNYLRLKGPFSGFWSTTFHIYLDASTAQNSELAVQTIYYLTERLVNTLIYLRIVSSEEAYELLDLTYPLYNRYSDIYSLDKNTDRSLDIWIPFDDYNVQCATYYHYIILATRRYWIMAGPNTFTYWLRT